MLLKKYKETSEELKKKLGLVFLTLTIIITFIILNTLFIGKNEKIVESDSTTENINSATNNETEEDDKKIISSLPSGKLNYYESSEGYKLSPTEYKAVCKNTKIVTQRSMMGANITNINAQKLYNENGNKIDKFSVKWDGSSNKCLAEYTIRALQGTSVTITVSGQAKGFLNTGVDTRVYFIKNF